MYKKIDYKKSFEINKFKSYINVAFIQKKNLERILNCLT